MYRFTGSWLHKALVRLCAGLLAILAEISGGTLLLNELAETRADLLSSLFPAFAVTRFDAAQIDDHLDVGLRPSVILMNPPFSAVANVDGRTTEATARHLRSALARLVPVGGLPNFASPLIVSG